MHWLIGLKKEYINIPRTTLCNQNFLFFLDETRHFMLQLSHDNYSTFFVKKKKHIFHALYLHFPIIFFFKSLFLYLFFWSNPSWSSKTLMLENLLGTKLMSVNHISYCKFNRELDVRVDWSLTLSICGFISGKNERKSL